MMKINNVELEMIVTRRSQYPTNHQKEFLLVGRSNVGKSSLLNALLREDKAIVTNIAGTTRDIVEGSISIDGVVLNMIDTAGIRETDDIIESMGVEKSKELINQADLVLLVIDGSLKLDQGDQELLELTNVLVNLRNNTSFEFKVTNKGEL